MVKTAFWIKRLRNTDYGVVAMFKSLLMPLAESIPALVVIALGIFIACFATNFMSNTVSATISASVFIPVLLNYSSISSGTIIVTAILIGCVANSAYLTYASSPTSGVILTDKTVSLKESVPYSSAMILATYIPVVVCLLPLLSKLF